MKHRLSRVAGVGAAVAVVIAGLVAVPAAAATRPSVQIKVCNKLDLPINVRSVWLKGTNQNHSAVSTYNSKFDVGGYDHCHTLLNYWWEIGSDIEVNYLDTPSTGTRSSLTDKVNYAVSDTVKGNNGGTMQFNLSDRRLVDNG
jgi:hypothetical protein